MILGCIGSLGVIAAALLLLHVSGQAANARVLRRPSFQGHSNLSLLSSPVQGISLNQTLLALGTGAAFVSLLKSGLVLFVLVVAGTALVVRLRAQRERARAEKEREEAIPELLESVVRHVRSGASLLSAYEEVAREASKQPRLKPIARELAHVMREVTLGTPFVTSLSRWSLSSKERAIQSGVLATLVSYGTGASSARGLDAASSAVAAMLEGQQLARTHAAQAVVSAAVLAVMPVVVTGALLVLHGGVREFLLHTTVGAVVLFVGLGFNGVGLWWMQRIIREVKA